LAKYLKRHDDIKNVYYPGLKSHPQHELAKSQMKGFGGMLSFELNEELDALKFQNELKLIKPAMSLAGVESTMVSPFLTSHASLSQKEREALGIRNGLIRFSVGIESVNDIIDDIEQAIIKVKNESLITNPQT
jgi:cystathionine beta-lyase